MNNPNKVNKLTAEKWSSESDFITLSDATPYERKIYQNRYFLAFEKCVKPCMHLTTVCRVIDAACGDGAGTAYIAERIVGSGDYLNIEGVDLDEAAIVHAKATYSRFPNLAYVQGDILEELSKGPFFSIICMETIEHVPKEIAIKAVDLASKNLLPGGKAIFSCPRLRPRESTKRRPGHINELHYHEFKYLLGEYFPMVEYLSFDRYGNIVPDYPDCNVQVGICSTWPATTIF